MFFFKIIVFHLIVTSLKIASSNKLKTRNLFVLHKWKEMELRFPLDFDREFAVKNGLYVKGVAIPIDFDFEYKEKNLTAYRIFVTLPRLTLGVPYTLGTIENNASEYHSYLLPYPNYSTHASHGADCNGITSAIRIFIDECKRLWVLDSGQIASLQFCPPKILAFDLKTDKLAQSYVIPKTQYIPGISAFTSMLADCRDRDLISTACKYTMIYIADSWGFGLIVYDTVNKLSWRIENSMMRPDNSLHRDGIFTISLSPRNEKERNLLFHSLGSKNEIFVPLRIIDDRSRWINKSANSLNDFKILGNRGIQCESQAMDGFGNLYCSVLSLNALIRWESKTEYNSDNLEIQAYNPEQIKFVTAMKVVKNSFGEDELWVLSNEPKLFSGGDFKETEIKFRLIGCRISDFLSGRKCTVDASRLSSKR